MPETDFFLLELFLLEEYTEHIGIFCNQICLHTDIHMCSLTSILNSLQTTGKKISFIICGKLVFVALLVFQYIQ